MASALTTTLGCIFCLSGLIVGFPAPQASIDEATFIGQIQFKGCTETRCAVDDFKGYGCRRGNCDLVCEHSNCYLKGVRVVMMSATSKASVSHHQFPDCENYKCSKRGYVGFECENKFCKFACSRDQTCTESVRQLKTAPKKLVTKIIFKSCTWTVCKEGDFVGYGCTNGQCELVCRKDKCRSEIASYQITRQHASPIVFSDCLNESSCRHENAIGYQCYRGVCKFVCQGKACFMQKQKSTKSQASKFIFHNCKEPTCKNGEYSGYECKQGFCELLCSKTNCSSKGKLFGLSIEKKLHLVFEGCQTSLCKSDQGHGYGCRHGRCLVTCNSRQCFLDPAPRPLGDVTTKARFDGKFVFTGCAGDICGLKDYHGYGCRYGSCELVCKANQCYNHDKLYVFDQQMTPQRPISFEGCSSISCKNPSGLGFKCHQGHCNIACTKNYCFPQREIEAERKLVSKKLSALRLMFDGCNDSRCQKNTTFGYKCKSGACDFVCEVDNCKYKDKIMVTDVKVEQVNIYFDGCLSKQCFNEEFDGFGCGRGKCNIVCNDKVCLDAKAYLTLFPPTTQAPKPTKSPEEEFDYGKELQKIQFSKFFNFGDKAFF